MLLLGNGVQGHQCLAVDDLTRGGDSAEAHLSGGGMGAVDGGGLEGTGAGSTARDGGGSGGERRERKRVAGGARESGETGRRKRSGWQARSRKG